MANPIDPRIDKTFSPWLSDDDLVSVSVVRFFEQKIIVSISRSRGRASN